MGSMSLKDLPLFEGLDDDVVDDCVGRFRETEMLAGTSLAREGEFAYKFFVVLDGEVEVQRDFTHVATLGPGDFFGEMGVLARGRRNARLLAQQRCRVGWMMGWEFEEMLEQHPEVAQRVQAVIDERMAGISDD